MTGTLPPEVPDEGTGTEKRLPRSIRFSGPGVDAPGDSRRHAGHDSGRTGARGRARGRR